MQNQPTPMRDEDIDAAILESLLEDDAQRPWSVDEVASEIEDPIAAADGLARLRRAGLIHRLDGFVFASRAALHAQQIAQ